MRLEPCTSSVVTVSANALVSDRNCIIQVLTLSPAAAACTVSLYDPAAIPNLTAGNATTVGATLRATLSSPASVGSVSMPLSSSGIEFSNGCIAVVTGVAATATVGCAKI